MRKYDAVGLHCSKASTDDISEHPVFRELYNVRIKVYYYLGFDKGRTKARVSTSTDNVRKSSSVICPYSYNKIKMGDFQEILKNIH